MLGGPPCSVRTLEMPWAAWTAPPGPRPPAWLRGKSDPARQAGGALRATFAAPPALRTATGLCDFPDLCSFCPHPFGSLWGFISRRRLLDWSRVASITPRRRRLGAVAASGTPPPRRPWQGSWWPWGSGRRDGPEAAPG